MREFENRLSLSQIPEAIAVVFLSVLTLLMIWADRRFLAYVIGTLAVGAFLAWFMRTPSTVVSISRRTSRFLAVVCYLGTAVMTILVWTASSGVPFLFYVMIVVIAGLLALLIATAPRLRTFVPIVLFATTIRATYWYAAPILGRDVRYHLAFTRYIVKTGELIPETVNYGYYHFYPIAHIVSAAVAEITGVSTRIAFFLAIGLGTVGGIVVVAAIIPRYIPLSRDGLIRAVLFTALYLAVAPFHLTYSTVLIAQSLMLLFIPITLLTFIADNRKLVFVGLFIAGVLLITHNAPGLVIVVTGGILMFMNLLLSSTNYPVVRRRTSANLVAVVSIGLVTYWISINYLDLQVARVSRLFAVGGSLSQTSSADAVSHISLFDPLLQTAIGLLFGGAFLIALSLAFARNITEENLDFPADYFIATSFLLAGIGAVLFVGLDTRIIRFVPLASIFVAPIVGYISSKIGIRGRAGIVVVVALMVLLPSFILVSAAGPGYSPGDAVTEPRPGLYRLYLSQSEIRGAETASGVTREITTNRYVGTSLAYQNGIRENASGVKKIDVMNSGWPTRCNNAFYIRDYYGPAFGVYPPQESDIVLDVGDARLATCPS
jgi:hypothetical protein